MTDTKPWYLSRTVWASIVTILIAAAGFWGLSIDSVDQATLTDVLLQAVTAIAGIVALVGRLTAKERIG